MPIKDVKGIVQTVFKKPKPNPIVIIAGIGLGAVIVIVILLVSGVLRGS